MEELLDDGSLQPSSSRLPMILIILVVLALLITGIGAIGEFSGTGWFSHRTILHEGGVLYVLNMDPEPKFVVVDGLERVEVPAGNAQLVALVGGTSRVEVFDAKDALLEAHDITVDGANAILKLTQEKCLAIVDITPYYRGNSKADINVLSTIKKDEKIRVLDTSSSVWPRRPFPKQIPGKGVTVWVELVGCALLDDKEFLDAYLDLRLHERVNKAMGKVPG